VNADHEYILEKSIFNSIAASGECFKKRVDGQRSRANASCVDDGFGRGG